MRIHAHGRSWKHFDALDDWPCNLEKNDCMPIAFFVSSDIPLKMSSPMYCNKIRFFGEDAIFHPNSTRSTATCRDTRIATDLIVLSHLLPVVIVIACNTIAL